MDNIGKGIKRPRRQINDKSDEKLYCSVTDNVNNVSAELQNNISAVTTSITVHPTTTASVRVCPELDSRCDTVSEAAGLDQLQGEQQAISMSTYVSQRQRLRRHRRKRVCLSSGVESRAPESEVAVAASSDPPGPPTLLTADSGSYQSSTLALTLALTANRNISSNDTVTMHSDSDASHNSIHNGSNDINRSRDAADAVDGSQDSQSGARHSTESMPPLPLPCKKVCLVIDRELSRASDAIHVHDSRMTLLVQLCHAYGLIPLVGNEMDATPTRYPVQICRPRLIDSKEMEEFHVPEYISCCSRMSACESSATSLTHPTKQELLEFGLADDYQPQQSLFENMTRVASSSITAADLLIAGHSRVANFAGGRHHAQPSQASGFCYVSDIVLAIMRLQKHFPRVLYIDIDIHHGDAVQNAFLLEENVFTLSFHFLHQTFFPGTGKPSETGSGGGRFRALNVPLRENCSDASFVRVFASVVSAIWKSFRPHAVVLQSGCDGLAFDPIGKSMWNLTSAAYTSAVEHVVRLTNRFAHTPATQTPLMVLGGGGYIGPDVARTWTNTLAVLAGVSLPSAIPEHDMYHRYAPSFSLSTKAGMRTDKNTPAYIKAVFDFVRRFLGQLVRTLNLEVQAQAMPVASLQPPQPIHTQNKS
jgi:acetoin utilization deacetylase AcuC-like enzyme